MPNTICLDVQPKIKDIQFESLQILRIVDAICTRHQIAYWISWGTLLGAVRHQGFIPWDDDIDIGMMRGDYDRFRAIVESELPKGLFFQNKETDPFYPRRIIKVRSDRIGILENDEHYPERYHQGVFIDIFIHDYCSRTDRFLLAMLQPYIRMHRQRKRYPRGSLVRCLLTLRT